MHADLSHLASERNEIVVDGRGNAYIYQAGFDRWGCGTGQRQHRAGHPCRFGPPGDRRGVVPQRHGRYPDNPTLIVAESYSSRLTAFDINQSGNLPQCPGREE
jgi:hypothetical protein